MKHIWWINHHAVPPIVPGGTRHYSLAKEIMNLGDYKVTIINGSFDHLTPHFEEGAKWGSELSAPVLRCYDGVDFLSLPTPYYEGNASLGRLKNMWSFYKNAQKYLGISIPNIIDRPDMIIGSTVHPLAAYAGYKLSQRYNVPFIYEVRDLWPLTLVEIGKISKYNPVALAFGYLDRTMAKASELIITTAPLMQNYYIDNYRIDASKFIWITNGSDITKVQTSGDDRIGNNAVIRIGYTGTLGLANGIELFLKNLNEVHKDVLKHFNFTFIGNGIKKPELITYCKKYYLPVIFQSAVPKNNIVDVLTQFDMLLVIVLPSPIYRYGTSLNKMADYFAIGRPIMMIGNVAQNPVIESGAGFIGTDINDLEAILKSIIACSPEDLQKKANNARAYAALHYDWTQLSKRLLEKLKPLMQGETTRCSY